jgi:hypothetical protein
MTGIEVAAIAGTAITVGDVLLVAGTAASALGALSSAQSQSAAAKYNAKISENNALAAKQQAAADEDRQRRLSVQAIGAQRAAYGASGVSLEGSPLDILEQSAYNAELDAQTIRWQGEVAAAGYGNQAILDRSKSNSALNTGYAEAGSSILIGGTKLSDRFEGRAPKLNQTGTK